MPTLVDDDYDNGRKVAEDQLGDTDTTVLDNVTNALRSNVRVILIKNINHSQLGRLRSTLFLIAWFINNIKDNSAINAAFRDLTKEKASMKQDINKIYEDVSSRWRNFSDMIKIATPEEGGQQPSTLP